MAIGNILNQLLGNDNIQPTGLDTASSQIPSGGSGVWGVLAQVARARGMNRLHNYALTKEEEDRNLKKQQILQQLESSKIDDSYKQRLMEQIEHSMSRQDVQDQRQQEQDEATASQKEFQFKEQFPESATMSPSRIDEESGATVMPIQTSMPDKMEVKFGGGRSMMARPRSKQDVESDVLRQTREEAKAKRAGEMFSAPVTSDIYQDGRLVRPGHDRPDTSNTQVMEIADPANPSRGIKAKIINGQVYTFDGRLVKDPIPAPSQAQGPDLLVYDQISGKLLGAWEPRTGRIIPAPPQFTQGGRAIGSTERAKLAGFQPLYRYLQDVANLSAKVHLPGRNSALGNAATTASGYARNAASNLTGYDNDLKELYSLGAQLPQFARQFGDVGNIAVEEAERVLKTLPLDATFNAEQAQRLINNVWNILRDKEQSQWQILGTNAPPRKGIVYGGTR